MLIAPSDGIWRVKGIYTDLHIASFESLSHQNWGRNKETSVIL